MPDGLNYFNSFKIRIDWHHFEAMPYAFHIFFGSVIPAAQPLRSSHQWRWLGSVGFRHRLITTVKKCIDTQLPHLQAFLDTEFLFIRGSGVWRDE